MKILVTAGNTQTPIDQVRCITNIFSGRTGTCIALVAFHRAHDVCLLTSRPEVIEDLSGSRLPMTERWRVRPYRTFDDLHQLMQDEIVDGDFDAVIHVAAVSDYAVVGTYGIAAGTTFNPDTQTWYAEKQPVRMLDAGAGKVKSHHQALWLRLLPTPKLVDCIRNPWGFDGILVKFKLEVGVTEGELGEIAENSRQHSQADVIVANTLEGMNSWALIKSRGKEFVRVCRKNLSAYVVNTVEDLKKRKDQN